MKHIRVQVGSQSPSDWDLIEAQQREAGEMANPWLRSKRRPAIAADDLGWDSLGIQPRWIGLDSADSAAALQPSVLYGEGDVEFKRFRDGAESRQEIALVISPIGVLHGAATRSIFDDHDSISLGSFESYVSGQSLPLGAEVQLSADLEDADRDLALRLRNSEPGLLWRSLSLHGSVLETWDRRIEHEPAGTLVPILETALGEPVAAFWCSPDGVERRYIVPAETPWRLLLDWLVAKALPAFVPKTMLRARRNLASDTDLMTRSERAARVALDTLEVEYAAQKFVLTEELESAVSAATEIRDGLLYGTGNQLVEAVRRVFEAAGITAVDLDETLEGTKSADLLCTYDGRSRLVEVKSAGGNAPERQYEDLLRHVREWPYLPNSCPIDGGALIVNHQHRLVPSERSREPYSRPEFLAAASEPIVPSLMLLDYWREEDFQEIRRTLFPGNNTDLSEANVPQLNPDSDADSAADASRKRWPRFPARRG